jgi:hypothetical protein
MPGGIFSSQVIDVCTFLRNNLECKVTLISFVSLRGFGKTRNRIREQMPDAIVLPMWPGIQRWKKNGWLLRRTLRTLDHQRIIARGPFAAMLALKNSSAGVCFDARGAYAAEFSEYNVGSNKIGVEEIKRIEAEVIDRASNLIAVSSPLVQYWKREYGYTADKHVIIPCTLSGNVDLNGEDHGKDKLRIVFSGGNGKWQSLDLLSQLLEPAFERNKNIELFLLTQTPADSIALKIKYPERVHVKWLQKPEEVHALLRTCDYGWLVRENTVTNQVASPVKFAEYLAAGLSVVISENLGDFSSFVKDNECGVVIQGAILDTLEPISIEQRRRNQELAKKYFLKEAYKSAYRRCIA